MMNCKGTLHVRQHKDNDPLQFIVFYGLQVFRRFLVEKGKRNRGRMDDCIWITVLQRITVSAFCKDALQFGKGLVKYM